MSPAMRTIVAIADHPLLELETVELTFEAPLGDIESPPPLAGLLDLDADAPMQRTEEVRIAVRKLLRVGGFKPSGRSKPASEYLVKAAQNGFLRSINKAVDLGNAVSLHSGLPISVVDLGKAKPPLLVDVAPAGSSYVFNASGQVLDAGHLLGLRDADGPCANAVKDAQRTKTDEATTSVLILIWGTNAAPGRAAEAAEWLRRLAGLSSAGPARD